ncbi:MAG: hypothetical protein ACK4SZ_04625 [Allosphingosinicella sp.]|uniref:hypothetical protein n=1 Tax=Allosphingosinicella sp. TaxID=2823234 RepID=UPI003961A742
MRSEGGWEGESTHALPSSGFQYGYEAATAGFPPMAGTIVVVGVLLVLFANHARRRG